LDNITVFGLMMWVHPSIFVNPGLFAPCEGFQQLVDKLAAPFRINFGTTITGVVRDNGVVTISYNSKSAEFDFIVFTNKWAEGESNFIDMRPAEIDAFSGLATTHVRSYIVSADHGVFTGADRLVTANNVALDSWYPTQNNWTYICLNYAAARYPGLDFTGYPDVRVCAQYFYDDPPPLTVTNNAATAELENFLNHMGATTGGTPLTTADYTIVATFDTPLYWQKFYNISHYWDIWEMQGKYNAWYLGSACTGMESAVDMMDYAKQLSETYAVRTPAPTPPTPPAPEPQACYGSLAQISAVLVLALCTLIVL